MSSMRSAGYAHLHPTKDDDKPAVDEETLPVICGGPALPDIAIPAWPPIRSADREALISVYDSGKWGCHQGTLVTEFAERFASFHGARYGVCAVNGTLTLVMAMRALGLRPGDEVIVPAYTFVATASAVLLAGGVPVFADIDAGTCNIDAASVRQAISERTVGIIPVHIGGQPADMDEIMDVAKGLWVIEDCAQAHGSAWAGHMVGSIGDIGSFSFQASKNLAAGEGGMVITSNQDLYEKCWAYHTVGRARGGGWYQHESVGSNLRMTEFQAALLLAQLDHLEEENDRRAASAALLDEQLGRLEGIVPRRSGRRVTRQGYHLYLFRYHPSAFEGLSRAGFVRALQAEGIPASLGYRPLYKEPMFQRLETPVPAGSTSSPQAARYADIRCEVTELLCNEAVWLPQRVLLASPETGTAVVDSIARIQRHAREVAVALGDA